MQTLNKLRKNHLGEFLIKKRIVRSNLKILNDFMKSEFKNTRLRLSYFQNKYQILNES